MDAVINNAASNTAEEILAGMKRSIKPAVVCMERRHDLEGTVLWCMRGLWKLLKQLIGYRQIREAKSIMAEGRQYMIEAPWIITIPGAALMITVLGLNLLGDGLRDVLDPRLRIQQ